MFLLMDKVFFSVESLKLPLVNTNSLLYSFYCQYAGCENTSFVKKHIYHGRFAEQLPKIGSTMVEMFRKE